MSFYDVDLVSGPHRIGQAAFGSRRDKSTWPLRFENPGGNSEGLRGFKCEGWVELNGIVHLKKNLVGSSVSRWRVSENSTRG